MSTTIISNETLFDPSKDSKTLNPTEYFNAVKERRNTATDETLQLFYDNCLILIEKYRRSGQRDALRKLLFQIDCIEKERELVKAGINTFVYEDDITEYIENVAGRAVKIIDIENYQRDIPDDIVDIIEQVGNLFDKMYIVFTDYTGKEEKRIKNERREKDPILFGTFRNEDLRHISERFWYLGDWVDEYCDLTLDKMVADMKSAKNKDIIRTVITPTDLSELKAELAKTTPTDRGFERASVNQSMKKPFWTRVKTFLNMKG